jgi:restriction system protein
MRRRRSRQRKPGILAQAPWQLNLPLTGVFAGAAYFHTQLSLEFSNLAAAQLKLPLLATALNMPLNLMFLVGGSLAALATAGFTIKGLLRARKRRKERALAVQAVANTRTLDSLDWRQFEFLVAQHFKDQGYRVSEGAGVKDGGIDITLVRDNEKLLVQCKHWKNSAVGVVVVRELAGVVQLNKANGGVVVCSGRYTSEAETEARQLGIHLLTGEDLLRHLGALPA